MRLRTFAHTVTALATATLLAGCGGGGADAGDSTSYNALAAWTGFLSAGHGWTVTGTGSDGAAYSIQLGTTPVGNATFPFTGAAANRLDVSVTVRKNGGAATPQITQLYYDNSFRVLGSADNAASPNCNVATSASLPPTGARIGNGGPLYTANLLNGCGNTAPVGTETATWSVELEAGIRYFCINSTQPVNGQTYRESDCFEITGADGTIGPRARISITYGTLSLVARS